MPKSACCLRCPQSRVTPLRISCKDSKVSTRQIIYFIKKTAFLILYLKILPCYNQYSWKRFLLKLWRSWYDYTWIFIHRLIDEWQESKIIRCLIKIQPLMRLDFIDLFYRFISSLYVVKDFNGVLCVTLKNRPISSSCMAPPRSRWARGQLFRRKPGMRNITQKLLTRYIFRSCISTGCKKVLLRNHKRVANLN